MEVQAPGSARGLSYFLLSSFLSFLLGVFYPFHFLPFSVVSFLPSCQVSSFLLPLYFLFSFYSFFPFFSYIIFLPFFPVSIASLVSVIVRPSFCCLPTSPILHSIRHFITAMRDLLISPPPPSGRNRSKHPPLTDSLTACGVGGGCWHCFSS